MDPVQTNLYFRDAVLAFKCMTGMVPEYLSDKVKTRGSVSGRNTRNSFHYIRPRQENDPFLLE